MPRFLTCIWMICWLGPEKILENPPSALDRRLTIRLVLPVHKIPASLRADLTDASGRIQSPKHPGSKGRRMMLPPSGEEGRSGIATDLRLQRCDVLLSHPAGSVSSQETTPDRTNAVIPFPLAKGVHHDQLPTTDHGPGVLRDDLRRPLRLAGRRSLRPAPPTQRTPDRPAENRRKCPCCGEGTMILVETIRRQIRAPP